MKKLFLIYSLLILGVYNHWSQEITYQRPIEDLNFYSLKNGDYTFRVRVNSDIITVTKFDENMAFQDLIAIYPKDIDFTNDKGKKVKIENFNSFENTIISKNYLHILMSADSKVKNNYVLMDLKLNTSIFTLESKPQILGTIKPKRAVNIVDGKDFMFTKVFRDSTMTCFYQKPGKFADDLEYKFIKLKVDDDLTVLEQDDLKLMSGIKRDFYKINLFYYHIDGSIILRGDKIRSDRYSESKPMYFIKEPDASEFKKMTFQLDQAEPIDLKIFTEDEHINLIGVAEKNESGDRFQFAVRYKKGSYNFPEYLTLNKDDTQLDFFEEDFTKILTSIHKYDDAYYLVYQYRKATEKNVTLYSYYFKSYDYHVKGFVVEKYDTDVNLVWTTEVPREYMADKFAFLEFTKPGFTHHNGHLVLLFNDNYENSVKSDEEDLAMLDFKFKAAKEKSKEEEKEAEKEAKEAKKEGRNLRDESIEIDELDTDYDFTITLVEIDKQDGEAKKINYQQRRLHSLILLRELQDSDEGKFYYPYYYGGKYGLCAINLYNF